jgi:hypothetical protein
VPTAMRNVRRARGNCSTRNSAESSIRVKCCHFPVTAP